MAVSQSLDPGILNQYSSIYLTVSRSRRGEPSEEGEGDHRRKNVCVEYNVGRDFHAGGPMTNLTLALYPDVPMT